MYTQVPSLGTWKRNSSHLTQRRSNDRVLCRIDTIVESLGREKNSNYLLGELFFATNYWLRNFQLPVNSEMKASRKPAIQNLFEYSARQLSKAFGCSINVLPRELEKYFGKSMSEHGRNQDSPEILGTRHYMKRAVTEQFKVHFKHGMAYQFEWRKQNPKLIKVESEYWHQYTVDSGKVLKTAWCHFVMSMSRDLYIGPHMNVKRDAGKVAVVHSSWLAGTPVQCAGSVCIDSGVVTGIQNNSGHYQPKDSHLVNVLAFLKMVGVPLSKVDVHDYMGRKLATGNEFLSENGNWEVIMARKGIDPKQDSETAKTTVSRPASGQKKQYKCLSCGRRYMERFAMSFCPSCRGRVVAAA